MFFQPFRLLCAAEGRARHGDVERQPGVMLAASGVGDEFARRTPRLCASHALLTIAVHLVVEQLLLIGNAPVSRADLP